MNKLFENYLKWLRQNFSYTQQKDTLEIQTPFLNQHNDLIRLFADVNDTSIRLHDFGETLAELELSGVDVHASEKRKNELDSILRSYGIVLSDDDELFMECDQSSFPSAKHRFLQGLLSVNDLFVLAEPKVENFFLDDVRQYFEENNIRAVENVIFPGKSGFNHNFDYSIPKSSKYPERIIKAVNTPRKDIISNLLFAFEDTKKNRRGSQGIVILNDENTQPHKEVFQALAQYQIEGVKWSERNSIIEKFAA